MRVFISAITMALSALLIMGGTYSFLRGRRVKRKDLRDEDFRLLQELEEEDSRLTKEVEEERRQLRETEEIIKEMEKEKESLENELKSLRNNPKIQANAMQQDIDEMKMKKREAEDIVRMLGESGASEFEVKKAQRLVQELEIGIRDAEGLKRRI